MTITAKISSVGPLAFQASSVEPLASASSSVGPFASRHIGLQADERDKMLAALGLTSLEELVDQAMPSSIRMDRALALPAPLNEAETLARLQGLAA